MELRNPSDALEILARSDNAPTEDPVSGPEPIHNTPSNHSISRSFPSTNNTDITSQLSRTPNQSRQTSTVLDDYELVQRELLHPSELPELLLIFAQNYHPYFPVTPAYFLRPLAMERICKPDYFLLTVILTIASSDSPNNSLTHRYCWDHTQRLLLGVLLAQSWAQTPRTVEGLLLLAEWLPHIQIEQTTSEAHKSLFSEDRTAWSLVGLAVRQGYLLRLDRAAFRAAVDDQSKDKEEHKRLVWAFVYMADRQISVRLGQSFWSRGPSLSSHFTAKDFPSLKPVAGVKDDNYASVLHSSLELTQILYNAHLILYASTERTLAMISDGDYARYLDDFVRAVTVWHTTWKDIQVSHKVKSTLLIMYEYIRLYVNAFSFQAVITRASNVQTSSQGTHQTSKRLLAELFSRGIMSSPDGKFIFDAIEAAMNLLKLMNNLDPRHVLCYLPSRYYLYGVYAAVFLHKAHSAGAFQSLPQRREVTSLALRFVTVMADTPLTESHICHRYSRMLRNLWQRGDARRGRTQAHSDMSDKGHREIELSRASRTRE
ncbi:C6 transcription factor [Fusarium albosuccineum]|uniref:C6 transcription factor n=1 Tax=Fusarium albosuccineum TaxID=1237068 RepID=A0A8H4LG13_9HYPO|nr:C6 transcription factor [Fusarium albosuccineum]